MTLPMARGACRPRHACWLSLARCLCFLCPRGASVGKRAGPAARWVDGDTTGTAGPRGGLLLAPLATWPTPTLLPWGLGDLTKCLLPSCVPRSRCWTSETLANGVSRKWKEPGSTPWGLRCGTWMASGSWERDRVGLEVRGGSSDFWATDGEPRNQFKIFNEHLLCAGAALCPRNHPHPSSPRPLWAKFSL